MASLTPSLALNYQGGQRINPSAPGLVYALIIFVWASGISALSLLIGIGLVALEGGTLSYVGPLSLGGLGRPYTGAGEALLVFVLLFKFLMGGGQFLLLAWYRFLPTGGLVFYLFFYYPAHLIVGTTFFLGVIMSPLSISLAIMVGSLLITAVCLLPHLGAQASPALTLAGSSFIGLSFLAVAMINIPI